MMDACFLSLYPTVKWPFFFIVLLHNPKSNIEVGNKIALPWLWVCNLIVYEFPAEYSCLGHWGNRKRTGNPNIPIPSNTSFKIACLLFNPVQTRQNTTKMIVVLWILVQMQQKLSTSNATIYATSFLIFFFFFCIRSLSHWTKIFF